MTGSVLDGLNDRQKEVASEASGAQIVIAGPGTGKTHTLAHRIAHLVREGRATPSQILAVTFTRSAAQEMRVRVDRLLEGERTASPGEIWIDTFHAAAAKILREESYPFGPGEDWGIADDEQKDRALEGLAAKKDRSSFLERVRERKQRLEFPEGEPEEAYQRRLFDARLLDFDDVLLHVCRLLEGRPQVLAAFRERIRYLIVDEFQDTSFAQYAFMRRIAPENVCVIGDPDQAIYGFASGDFRPFARFRSDFPQARVLGLAQNYRSAGLILDAAKQVIARNPADLPRALEARLERGLPIEVAEHGSDRQEAEWVGRKIEALIGGSSHFTIDTSWAESEGETYGYGFSDIAILYRFQAQARLLEKALERLGLPYRSYGKQEKRNGLPVTPPDDLEAFRASERAAPPQVLSDGETLSLMTLHRSKGLEFPVVFIVGCEDGILPGRDAEPEEERRLFFVGMTRAKARLFLSRAKVRTLYGRRREYGPSPFLTEFEERLREMERSRPSPGKRKKNDQPTLF